MPKSAYHHGDLRSALLEVTAQLVREKGARGFSVSEAARRVGVSIAAPYRHFDDREAMLAAVATRGFTELQATDLGGELQAGAEGGTFVVRARVPLVDSVERVA